MLSYQPKIGSLVKPVPVATKSTMSGTALAICAASPTIFANNVGTKFAIR